jgi:hypothetical protein
MSETLNKEQVDVLAAIAKSPRWLQKHVKWFKNAGIITNRSDHHHRSRWCNSGFNDVEWFYISIIDAVHANAFDSEMVIRWAVFCQRDLNRWDPAVYWARFPNIDRPWYCWSSREEPMEVPF